MGTSTITSASDIQMDYMQLLIAQLQNQNPLEPLDNNEMASQLAQFSQLAQLESMNTSFADVLIAANRTYANSLLGKNVTFYATNQISGALEEKVGIVDSVFNDPGTGESRVGVIVDNSGVVEEFTLGLSAVLLVQNQSEDLAFE